jgi:hypothetical protein
MAFATECPACVEQHHLRPTLTVKTVTSALPEATAGTDLGDEHITVTG